MSAEGDARHGQWSWLVFLVAMATLAGFTLRPVCVALTPEQLAGFTSPISERTDYDMYLRVFQQRNGQWFQCRTWISRQFFF
jgi:hypothetical protein